MREITKHENNRIDNSLRETENLSQPAIFLSSYTEKNLKVSKEVGIVGWEFNSKSLSSGDLLFIYNTNQRNIETCFKIDKKIEATDFLWPDEIEANKILYKHRWNAKIVVDKINLPLDSIQSITPFDKERFSALLRSNFPLPLSSINNKEKYSKFRQVLLEKIQPKSLQLMSGIQDINSNQFLSSNYWIFIVTDKPEFKLSANEIYQTRMNDGFWGLNERTSYRKQLKKGDEVIFCYRTKKFLGTAKLATDCFELNEEQKVKFSHGHDYYKHNYGVMLSDIEIWAKSKDVSQDIYQFPKYFQGAIKKIRASDYNLITGKNPTKNIETIFSKDLEFFIDKPLPIPTNEQIKEGYEKISKFLLIPKDKVIEILTALTSGRHILLAGPIGTGKTRLASLIPEIFWENIGGYKAEAYTATSDWNTQDVIGGIYPKMNNDRVVYDIQYGCVVDTVAKNWELGINGGRRCVQNNSQENKLFTRGTWLIIDEFNRADIDKSFGQLFTSLRTRSLKIPTKEIGLYYKDLRIPQDYRIIGTLNTADKHFLFQLSDALKSRFAYIEIDIPRRQDYEKEIYYAMKNAISELEILKENYEGYVELDDVNQKILPGKVNSDFYNFVLQAYYYLDSIRIFKKLGTAILQLIYQSMLVAIRITGDSKSSLDNALTSTLLPQLENLPLSSLGVLDVFYNNKNNQKDENIVKYLKAAYNNPSRQSFVESFDKVLRYLEIDNYETIIEEFSNGVLNINNNTLWTTIEIAFENKKKNINSDLVLFNSGINDLRKSAVV